MALQKSLQLLRLQRLSPVESDPNNPASAGPFLPVSYSTTARPASRSGSLNCVHFHIFVTPCPLSPFREVPGGTCRGLTCATILKNQLELSRGKGSATKPVFNAHPCSVTAGLDPGPDSLRPTPTRSTLRRNFHSPTARADHACRRRGPA